MVAKYDLDLVRVFGGKFERLVMRAVLIVVPARTRLLFLPGNEAASEDQEQRIPGHDLDCLRWLVYQPFLVQSLSVRCLSFPCVSRLIQFDFCS